MISHRNSKHFFPEIFLWKFQIVSLRNPKLPLLPRSLSDPTTPVWNSELLHLSWVTGGFQWWTPRQSASPRGNRWALLLCSWVSKRSNWPDHESVRRVRNFSKFAGRPIKNTVQNGALLHRSTIESCPQFRLSAADSDLRSLPSSKLPIPFGQNLHSGPFRQNGYYHPRDAPGCVISARFGNVWMVSDRCPTALPSADVSLRRRQPRRRVELPHVESLCTNIGWHFSFRLGDFSAKRGCWELAAREKLSIALFGSNLFWCTCTFVFCLLSSWPASVSHKGTRWWTRHRATPNNRILTNKQNNLRRNTSKKHDRLCYCPKLESLKFVVDIVCGGILIYWIIHPRWCRSKLV